MPGSEHRVQIAVNWSSASVTLIEQRGHGVIPVDHHELAIGMVKRERAHGVVIPEPTAAAMTEELEGLVSHHYAQLPGGAYINKHNTGLQKAFDNAVQECRPVARLFAQVENNDWQASLISIPLSTKAAVIGYSDSEVTYGVFTDDPSVAALSNLSVATIRTNSRSGFQEQLTTEGAVIVEVDSLDQGYRMIRAGRVDAVLGVGVDGVPIGAPNPETLQMAFQLAVLPFTLFVNMNTPQGREAVRLLTD